MYVVTWNIVVECMKFETNNIKAACTLKFSCGKKPVLCSNIYYAYVCMYGTYYVSTHIPIII